MRDPGRFLPFLALLLLALFLGQAGPIDEAQAEESEVENDWQTLLGNLVEELEELAAWCHKARLFEARNATYESLLRFESDHAKARQWLKYKRAKDGSWQRRASYKSPRNLASAGSEWMRRSAALGNHFADAVQGWLKAHAGTISKTRRARAIWEAARLAPQRAALHEENGEVRGEGGTWLLKESQASRRRRPALRTAARKALEAAPDPDNARPTTAENQIGLKWKAILEGPHARVLGTVSTGELREASRLAEACFPLFQVLFDEASPALKGLALILLKDKQDKQTLLARYPLMTESYRAWAKKLASGWLPQSRTVFIRGSTRGRRLEWSARQPSGSQLKNAFGISFKQGWVVEGVGLYFSHLISGRRQTFFVKRTKYEDRDSGREGDLWDRLRSENSDWMAAAETLLLGPSKPDLRLLLGKGLDTMNTEDMLLAYALAAYLLEGRDQDAAPLLRSVGRGKVASPKAFEDMLGMDVPLLEERLIRWLRETRGPA